MTAGFFYLNISLLDFSPSSPFYYLLDYVSKNENLQSIFDVSFTQLLCMLRTE